MKKDYLLNAVRCIFILFLTLIISCTSNSDIPKPYGALPSSDQLKWHEMEYFSLVCYGLNTYTEVEWAFGDVDPKLFTPTDLNTDQWAKVTSEAGMKGLILVAKHHDGFCLWPSKYTQYSVKATPWKDGKGDILGDLAKSCKKYGLKLGVYISPWDRNHAEYGRPEYVDYYYKQLEETMTEYGDVFEFWLDGANGGTGYYGGANEKRNIDRKTYYGYEKIFSIVKKHQPEAVIFSDVGPGTRWVGNENGIGGETNWNTINTNGLAPGESDSDYRKKLGTGESGGNNWIPAEVNTTLLWPKAWYYHTGKKPRNLSNLMDLYYTSIGRGSPLNLGLAIAPSGRISDADAKALHKFKKQVDREFEDNLITKAKVKTSNKRGNSSAFNAKKCYDQSTGTYWATDDNVKNAYIEIDFNNKTTINRLLLQEYIALGQRVKDFSVEAVVNGKFTMIAEGTTVGYKRIIRFDDVKTTKVKITFKTDAECLAISNIGIYNAPPVLASPILTGSKNGNVSISASEGLSIYYALGTLPAISDYKKYTKTIFLPKGGVVNSYAINDGTSEKTDIVSKEFGISKSKWGIDSFKGDVNSKETALNAIDGDPDTYWITTPKSGTHSQQLAINLGEEANITGFSYTPRERGADGTIFEYEFYVSKDGKRWGEPVIKGEFSNIENNPVTQVVKFEKTVSSACYIKLVSKSAIRNSKSTSIAEIDIFTHK